MPVFCYAREVKIIIKLIFEISVVSTGAGVVAKTHECIYWVLMNAYL